MAESVRNSGIPTWATEKRRYVKEVREILWPTATYCVSNDSYPMGPYFRRSFWSPLVLCAASSILAVEIWVFRRSISVRQSLLQLFGGSQTKGVAFWWCSIEWRLRICREMVSRLYIEQFFFLFSSWDFFPSLRQRWRLEGKILRKYIMVIVGSPTQP